MQTVQPLTTDIFRTNVQYIIPKYQRHYVWDREQQWEPLWADVEALVHRRRDRDAEPHFLGTLITKEIGTERNVTQWRVVDGQQRLTTLQILLAAVRNVLEDRNHKSLAEQLADLVQNPAHSVVKKRDCLKILPKGRDYAGFSALLFRSLRLLADEEEQSASEGGLSGCYRFFRQRAELWMRENETTGPQRLAAALQRGLQFVEIRLGDQNEHAIFEALNARGEPLTEWEKTKNYLLSLAPDDDDRDGSQVYERYIERFDAEDDWSEIVKGPRFSGARVDQYLRYFAQIALPLVSEPGRYDRRPLRQDWLYREVRQVGERRFHRDRGSYLAFLEDLVRYSELYRRVSDRSAVLSEAAQTVLRHRVVNRMDSLIPVVMVLLERCGEGKMFELCLKALDSFMMRRIVVYARNDGFDDEAFKMVRRIAACPTKEDVPRVLVEQLRTLGGSLRWPDDVEVERELEDGEAKASRIRCKMLLEGVAAEMEAESPEKGLPWQPNLKWTMEHVVPQDWEEHWKTHGFREGEIGEEWRLQQLVERWGNLTLVNRVMNSKLSNRSWEHKRKRLAEDNIVMNQRVAAEERWGEDEIRQRGADLARYVKRVWPGPQAMADVMDSGGPTVD